MGLPNIFDGDAPDNDTDPGADIQRRVDILAKTDASRVAKSAMYLIAQGRQSIGVQVSSSLQHVKQVIGDETAESGNRAGRQPWPTA